MPRRFILSLRTCVSVGVSGIANHQRSGRRFAPSRSAIRPAARQHPLPDAESTTWKFHGVPPGGTKAYPTPRASERSHDFRLWHSSPVQIVASDSPVFGVDRLARFDGPAGQQSTNAMTPPALRSSWPARLRPAQTGPRAPAYGFWPAPAASPDRCSACNPRRAACGPRS
jgi:hypothetical protein